MRINCLHGYYYFHEGFLGEIARFNSRYEQDLVFTNGYYTFKAIADFPSYVIKGEEFAGFTFTKSYEGKPELIFRENKIVYDFLQKKIVLLNSITQNIATKNALTFSYLNGLILAGSKTQDLTIIKGYICTASVDSIIFKYSELYK